nr:MAG TPA: adenylate kinase [Caudoviricetes sp.]
MGRKGPQIQKICTICGKPFKVFPSAEKQECCSKKCGAALRARRGLAGGSKWSEKAKSRRASDSSIRNQMAKIQQAGTSAALQLAAGQRGPQNREALVWILIDPMGNYHKAVGLNDWARKNRLLFFEENVPEETAAMRIGCGFGAIASTMRGKRKNSRPVMTYKGWRLAELPREKKPEDDNFNNAIAEEENGEI